MTTPTPEPRRMSRTPATSRDGKILAALILLLTAAVALAWSHTKLLSQDEIFVLQTDSVRSVSQLINIQRHFPISLDPLFYHLLAHACTKLLGPTPLALRLPSILGFLLMQLCLFLATRRIAGERAALIAMAFPAFTATLFYAPEARPYGLLLGLYALAFYAWQSATRATPSQPSGAANSPGAPSSRAAVSRAKVGSNSRTSSLILLFLAIALTLNSHYFGILLLIPVCLAELTRTILRRKLRGPHGQVLVRGVGLDVGVIAAILLGMASIVFTLPFQHAAGEFRKHYYNAGVITLRAVSQAYRSLFVNYTTEPLATQRVEAILLVLFAIAVIALCILRLRRRAASAQAVPAQLPGRVPPGSIILPTPELIFLIALAALPLFGVALAMSVTHSIEVRYVLSAIIAIAIFFAIAIGPSVRRHLSPTATAALVLLGILIAGFLRVRDQQTITADQLALLALPPALKSQLLALPDQHLYIQDMGHFELASYYEPDPAIRSRIALLYSRPEELKYDGHDTASLTAEHMQHFTAFDIVSYAQLKATPSTQPTCPPNKPTSAAIPHEPSPPSNGAGGASAPCDGAHMLVLYHSGWDWTDQALAADAHMLHITPLGSALDGDAVLLHSPAAQ